MYYDNETNQAWPLHCDGDLATFNICLTASDSFNGGILRLYPSYQPDKNNTEVKMSGGYVEEDRNISTVEFIDYLHNIPGNVIFHQGNVFHEVTPVTAGKRITLIVKLFSNEM